MMTTAIRAMISIAMTLNIRWSNLRCMNIARTNADLAEASKRATTVVHLVSSICVTATETVVRTISSKRINPYVR